MTLSQLTCHSGALRVQGGIVGDAKIMLTAGSAPLQEGTDLGAGRIVLKPQSRLYLADSCGALPDSYTSWGLMDRTLSFTISLGDAGCGCIATAYSVGMRQNRHFGQCSDGEGGHLPGNYYCDANAICGERCDEIDFMEANKYAFHSVCTRTRI